ncbi:hypothetical protein KY289_012218 [Solanum tuberosum]|nr:hypothetical protein KY289_012218 [Solanum tuberosum]
MYTLPSSPLLINNHIQKYHSLFLSFNSNEVLVTRAGKTVTQAWQYKGVIRPQVQINEQKTEQGQSSTLANSQNRVEEICNQVMETGSNKQTPEGGDPQQYSLRPNTIWPSPEFNLTNFPVLTTIPTKNRFKSLMHSKLDSLPIDWGGAPQTCQ